MISFRDNVAAYSNVAWVTSIYALIVENLCWLLRRQMENTTSDLHSNSDTRLVMRVSGALYMVYTEYNARMNTQRLV